jgi:hypothetical protein
MSSWRFADFRVIPDGRAMYPLPERDSDGVPRYKAKVKAKSETEYKNLLNNISIVTIRRGLGSFNFVYTIEAGVGVGDLYVPVKAGYLGYFEAILVKATPIFYGRGRVLKFPGDGDYYYELDCEWIITSDDITPTATLPGDFE